MAFNSTDIYKTVTGQFIEALKDGNIPWEQDWSMQGGFLPRSLGTKKEYNGLNPFLLGLTAQRRGYTSPWWCTAAWAKKNGGSVRKGQSRANNCGATIITAWRVIPQDDKLNPKTGKMEEQRPKFFLGYHNMFNLEQCEGIEAPELPASKFAPEERAHNIIEKMPNAPEIYHNWQTESGYAPGDDVVYLRDKSQYNPVASYYGDAFHQLVHATGHGDRLNRFDNGVPGLVTARFDKEELVANLGSAMLAGRAGIRVPEATRAKTDIEKWVEAFEDDYKLVVSAGSRARKACDYIAPTEEVEDE